METRLTSFEQTFFRFWKKPLRIEPGPKLRVRLVTIVIYGYNINILYILLKNEMKKEMGR